jgi:hypothetical protein
LADSQKTDDEANLEELLTPIRYGSGDSFGSGNCNTASSACGFYNNPGYNAAASQNLYGAGPGAGAGPACNTCWRLSPSTDSSGNALHGANSIVVKVNNLCPANGMESASVFLDLHF